MEDYEIKARALVMSYFLILQDMDKAKQCATIACKEIIEACEYNDVESWNSDWWQKTIESIQII